MNILLGETISVIRPIQAYLRRNINHCPILCQILFQISLLQVFCRPILEYASLWALPQYNLIFVMKKI